MFVNFWDGNLIISTCGLCLLLCDFLHQLTKSIGFLSIAVADDDWKPYSNLLMRAWGDGLIDKMLFYHSDNSLLCKTVLIFRARFQEKKIIMAKQWEATLLFRGIWRKIFLEMVRSEITSLVRGPEVENGTGSTYPSRLSFEVEAVVPGECLLEENSDGFTPDKVFENNHKQLVEAGRKWMKLTVTQCIVVAGLVATVAYSTNFTFLGDTTITGILSSVVAIHS
ncbi:hypothetical protein L6452_29039 [Arctium lappa]|uniref:Uncharacterized protein n=1 Tax=Arctium lappa TaxID=4217 RepID=A0ACB8ZH28_ARCLA|nr:hypothetical protein L6452_29039 [Arctium lappa]